MQQKIFPQIIGENILSNLFHIVKQYH